MVRSEHGTTDWFQIGKGDLQGCILSPCLFNLGAAYIMRNAMLDETQAAIKSTGRNINHPRYADNTVLMAEIEELKSFLMKVKEEIETVGLNLNIWLNTQTQSVEEEKTWESGAWEQGTGSWLHRSWGRERYESWGRGLSVYLHNQSALPTT